MNLILRHILSFGLFAFFQIVLFNQMSIGQFATPFPFLLFLLTLPFNLSKPILYLIAFGTGLFIDIFSDSYGLHCFSVLLCMGLREFWLNVISTSTYRSQDEIPIQKQNLVWIATYLLPLILIHHIAYFSLEALGAGFHNFFFTIFKVIGSTLYTFIVSFVIFGLFYYNKR